MTAVTWYYPPSQNALQKTLGADLNTGVTSAMTLNNTTNVQNKPGVVVVDRIDSSGTLKSTSVREFIGYTAVSGSTLTTLTRNIDNSSSDQDHAVGAVVEFVLDVNWAQSVIDALVGTKSGVQLLTPQIDTSINDTNGNEVIKTPATSSAVNEVTVTNAATGANPTISATGGDSTAALGLKGKSAGVWATGEYDNGNTSTAQTISGKNGDSQLSTVTGNVTYTFSNFTAGQKVVVRIVEDGTGGHTITLPTVKWPGGTAGTFTTTANAINLLAIYYDGTNYLVQLSAGFA